MSARTTALAALIACRKQGAWADGVLKEYIARDRLDRRDAALASRLCYGVLQNRMLLDHHIAGLLTGSIKKLQPVVLDILRLGLYQLLFLDKIPVSAAVNEAVEQGKRYANRSAAGLINGVLRRAARERSQLQPPAELSVRFSHPAALVELLRDSVGDEGLEALLESHNQIPATVIQVNTLVSSDDAVLAALEQVGAEADRHPWLDHAFLIRGYGSLERMELFRQGGFLCRIPRRGWPSWLPVCSRECRFWMAAPPRAARALPPPSPWKTRAPLSPVIFMPTRSTCYKKARRVWGFPFWSRGFRTRVSLPPSGRTPWMW